MPEEKSKPVIEPTENGPYHVTGIADFRNSWGDPIPTEDEMWLCRCGHSSHKPFCDGTHEKVGFSGKRLNDGSQNRVDDYPGRELTIHDNRWICSHAGFCTDQSPEVFDVKKEPWIDPDGGPAEKTMETIRRCPSGALAYTTRGGEHYRDQARAPAIHIAKDGPLYVVGGPTLITDIPPQSPEHYALCRCGASNNKPYCDGTHWKIEFRDDEN